MLDFENSLLRKTFLHLKGISATAEAKLWQQGVHSWDDLRLYFSKRSGKKAENILLGLAASEQAMQKNDLSFFASQLPSKERWRLIPHCLDKIAYLDIESCGAGYPPLGSSTVIAFYFQGQMYQEHDYRKKRELIDMIRNDASMLCTFNGLCFDVPFLENEFDLSFKNMPHLDLRPWMRKLGFTGGLKKIQTQFSEIPQRLAMDIDGYDAVILWRWVNMGMPDALETLYTYNAEDTWVLEPLLVHAYNLETVQNSILQLKPLPLPVPPASKTKVSQDIYLQLKYRKQSHEAFA